MNVIDPIKTYVDKIVSCTDGMKVLLLDNETTQIISMVYSVSSILEKEVYLVERLQPAPSSSSSVPSSSSSGISGTQITTGEITDTEEIDITIEDGTGGMTTNNKKKKPKNNNEKVHEAMTHLKAICILRPTKENIMALKHEIQYNPMYSEYHIFFTNICNNNLLRLLADSDEHDVIRQIQEYYLDYMAVNNELFHMNTKNSLSMSSGSSSTTTNVNDMCNRNIAGILALLLSHKKKPSQIRYQGSSLLSKKLANEIWIQLNNDQIFDFHRGNGPMLIILDRKDDPVTPLLSQWTYQAMVHELLGLNNNRVKLKNVKSISKGNNNNNNNIEEEVVLSCTEDAFFNENRMSNFGDLGTAVKSMLNEYQKHTKMNENINTIDEMQNFLERYPAFKSHSLNVSKHVNIMSELARLVDYFQLLDISQLEQELACSSDDFSSHFTSLEEKIMNPKVQEMDKIRLAILFVLRYETQVNMNTIKGLLRNNSSSHASSSSIEDNICLLDGVMKYAGSSKRAPGLYGDRSFMSNLKKNFKNQVEGVENVYCQHIPLCMNIIDMALKGKLKETQFPATGPGQAISKPDVIVFIVGGVTYEESLKVAELNTQLPQNQSVIIGGSEIHNSTNFLSNIRKYFC